MFTANSLRVGARSRLVLLSHLSVLPLVLPYSGLEPDTFGRCVVLLVRTFAYTGCRALYRVKLVRVCQFRYHQSSLKLGAFDIVVRLCWVWNTTTLTAYHGGGLVGIDGPNVVVVKFNSWPSARVGLWLATSKWTLNHNGLSTDTNFALSGSESEATKAFTSWSRCKGTSTRSSLSSDTTPIQDSASVPVRLATLPKSTLKPSQTRGLQWQWLHFGSLTRPARNF